MTFILIIFVSQIIYHSKRGICLISNFENCSQKDISTHLRIGHKKLTPLYFNAYTLKFYSVTFYAPA